MSLHVTHAVTALPLTRDNLVESAACARARWKIENESLNVLKDDGDNLAHNFRHGKQYLARMYAAINGLVFAFYTACDCVETLWRKPVSRSGRAREFFRIFAPSPPTSSSPPGPVSC